MPPRPTSRIVTPARFAIGILAAFLPNAQAQRGDAPDATILSAEEERALFHLPPGFEIQLVASEPDIQKPINLNFDSSGRLWVTSSQMYPWPAKTDALGQPIATFEKNWEENTIAFRGLAAPPAPEPTGRDSIRILSDFGPDGRARQISTFADGLNIPVGIQPLPRRPESKGDAVVAFSIPAIWLFEDTNGDGRADHRKKLFDGMGFGDTHGMSSNYLYWLDGWIYGNHGFKNRSEIYDPLSGKIVALTSGNTYRFRPDGSAFQHWIIGQTNPFGLAFDARGDLYSADSHSKPVYLLQRGGYYEGGGKRHDGLGFAPPITLNDHGSSSIAGIAVYEASHFPQEYHGNLFNGNPVTRRINRARLDWQGSTPDAVRMPDFLTCDDPSFRPVQVKLGPDGALWIADFYNPIIAHYELPLAHPSRDKRHARIWRVIWRGLDREVPPPPMPSFGDADARTLARKLSDPNLTVRILAANDLVERIGTSAIPILDEMARKVFPQSGSPASLPLASALERLGANDDQLLFRTLIRAGDDSGVAALRILGERPALGSLDESYFADLIASTQSGHVWRQLADVFARHPQPWQGPLLLDMHARTPGTDRQLLYGLAASLKQQVLMASTTTLKRWAARSSGSATFIADVCLAAGTPASAEFLLGHLENNNFELPRTGEYANQAVIHLPAERFAVVEGIVDRLRIAPVDQQLALAEGLAGAWQRPDQPLSPALVSWMRQTLLKSIARDDTALGLRAIEALKEFDWPEKNAPLGAVMLDTSAPGPVRRAALNAIMLNDTGIQILLSLITRTVDPTEEAAQRIAADRLASLGDNPVVREAFAKALPVASTFFAVRLASGLAISDPGAEHLIRLIETGQAPAGLLRHPWVAPPLRQRASGIQDRVAKITADLPSEDVRLEGVVRERTAAFAAASPDIQRGASLFQTNCAACHRLRDEGGNIGPSLDGLASRGVQRLVEDILDPNRNVDPAYRISNITKVNGDLISGLNLQDLGDRVLLTDIGTGNDIEVPRAEITEITRLATSPMPPVFEAALSPEDFHDLLAYLIGVPEVVAPVMPVSQTASSTVEPAPTPNLINEQYGPHERNVFDLWKARSETPTPLVVYIHGGGFRSGSKDSISPALVRGLLDKGISVMAINYRLAPEFAFPTHYLDSARAIQFARLNARAWNLDAQRIGATGGSAGAGTALWIAFHNDMADPDNVDPVLRQSTRLACVAVNGAQSTYDPRVISEWVGDAAARHPALMQFFGLTADEVDTPKAHRIYEAASSITYLTADDPPVYAFYTDPRGPLPANAKDGQGIHHINFGLRLKERMDSLGISCTVRHRDEGIDKDEDYVAFFLEQFWPQSTLSSKKDPRPSRLAIGAITANLTHRPLALPPK